jgi:hypothetical protein
MSRSGAIYRKQTDDRLEEIDVIPAAKPIIGEEERAAVDRRAAPPG